MCDVCGHGLHLHRSNVVSQDTRLDDPVPCYGLVAVARTSGAEAPVHCGCTAAMPS